MDETTGNTWETSTLHVDAVRARLTGHRALIIEEDAESFGRMFMSLAAAGCRAILARRPVQAFQIAARTPPTLVIFSTSVTGDVTGLVGDLRREAACSLATLVALGEGTAKRERRKLLELCCDGYVAKPADRFLFATELLLRTPRLLSPMGAAPREHASDRAVEHAAGGIRRATSSFEPPCRRSSP